MVGHSEGGVIAPMVAARNKDISFIVMLAGTGLQGNELLLLQKKLIERADNVSEDDIKKGKAINKGAFDIICKTADDKQLNEELKKYGKDKFIFKILRTCDSKWALAYFEIKEQIDRDVLFKEEYHNGIINCRIGKAPKAELEKYRQCH